ncbi:ParB/RepB/Spo0J family partition protein [Jannaschia sp. LMIT008]|uniref:ParB/RepB/Spo0J family partition protein n=1 Tax=Jannaschia maritima TaxID=3032585 RepID=UPI002812154A|nr:ParB/RepB/Spo0J family partition protein [Jannaschia sp. LMIT008]
MSSKHSAILDAVNGLNDGLVPESKRPARFLTRSNRMAERLSGEIEEKTWRRVDPASCRMWARHNRAYDLLTPENCADLIEGIRSQGQQEFPAIVRATGDAAQPYEVICGARRHFAVTWLRANNYPQFKYLIEVRDLTDEAAFRLADIENRDREDISDYERAVDYLDALERYYDGSQKDMAARLEMSPGYLSRFLQMARLPREIVAAFPSVRDIREPHARTLKKHLDDRASREALLARATDLAGQGLDSGAVMKALTASVAAPKPKAGAKTYAGEAGEPPIRVRRTGRKVTVEFPASLSDASIRTAMERYLADRRR